MLKLILTVDCEDFINHQSTLALYRILELLQKHDLRAIFFLTGHVCEKLSSIPKILDLLETHEIGYHSSSHSVHPNIFEYTDIESYKNALDLSLERETAHINPLTGECEGRGGFILLRDLWPNNKIVSFRAPGFCWSPPHLEALEKLGVKFDFSTNLWPVPIKYRKITFYPFPRWGYRFTAMVHTFGASLLTFRHTALLEHPQVSTLLYHPDNLVNANVWDNIYYKDNPLELATVPPKSWKETKGALQSFEMFLKRIAFLAKKGMLEVTPPLEEGKTKTSFTEADVVRVYRRSVSWPKRFFHYEPKFLLNHFFRYLNTRPGYSTYFDLCSHNESSNSFTQLLLCF